MIKVSVIVPIYNSEQYISRCVKSLINQTLENIEIILVNDGSSDNSYEIIKEFQKNNDNIKVINKKNSGVGDTRNIGIDNAIGEYIGFVDSDDWISCEMYSNLYNEAKKNNCDIAMCSIVKENKHGKKDYEKINIQKNKVMENILQYPESFRDIAGSTCKAIYRRSMLNSNKIRFLKDLPLSEDKIFNMYALKYANKIIYLDKYLYTYFENEVSAVEKYRENIVNEVVKVKIAQDEWFCNLKINNDNLKAEYDNQFISIIIQCILNEFKRSKNFNYIIKKINYIINNNYIKNFIMQNKFFMKFSLRNKIIYICIKLKASYLLYLYCIVKLKKNKLS